MEFKYRRKTVGDWWQWCTARRWFVAGVLLCAGCAGFEAPPVTGRLADLSPASAERLQRGYEVHQQMCGKCHLFVDPRPYSESAWRLDIMPRMAVKSELTSADADAVLEYLLAVRRLPADGAQ